MKRYGNLYEKIYSMDNLLEAHKNARRGKSWYKEIRDVDANTGEYLEKLQKMLIDHTYHTSKYEMFIKKENDKEREIYKLPYFPDRICQWAILQVIEPYLIKHLTRDTYSALPRRGIHAVLHNIQKAMHDDFTGCRYCFKMDIHHYYHSIDHSISKDQFRRIFKDPELLWILDEIIDSVYTAKKEGVGIPIGNYLSQWCGNLYLSWFDHWIKEEKHVKHYFRYMDDIVVFASTKEELHTLQVEITDYLNKNLQLKVKGNWQIFPSYIRGVDFVGYRVFREYTLLRKSTCKNFKRKMTVIRKKIENGKTINYSEWCSINSCKGWLEHCDSHRLQQKYIAPIQSFIDSYYQDYVRKGGKNHENVSECA